jgi:hypothetical protein
VVLLLRGDVVDRGGDGVGGLAAEDAPGGSDELDVVMEGDAVTGIRADGSGRRLQASTSCG